MSRYGRSKPAKLRGRDRYCTNNWGSHSRHSHSILKSVPLMPRKRLVEVTELENGQTWGYSIGFGSGARRALKEMHKKKRRQFFRREIMELL